MVVNEKGLKSLGVKPLARIHHMTMMGGDPVIMLDAPLHATKRALEKAGMSIDDIDLFEVNEAFAAGAGGVAEDDRRRPRRGSTSMAARSRSAIRSAAPAPS